MNELKIEYLSPDELIPYEKNAKMHPPAQVDHIANSIKAFGWKQPIVVDADNVVIIGHGRLLAAKQLHLDKVPAVYADDLSPDQVNALRLADNKTNESEWDFSKLEEELAALDIAGFDMMDFGFDDLSNQGGSIPDSLDDESDSKLNVVCSINFPSIDVYESVKAELQQIADDNGASLAVKMA